MRLTYILSSIAISCCLALNFLAVPKTASADETKIEVTDPNVMKAGLEHLIGKSVTVRVSGGEDITGIVEAVGPAAVRIGQLSGKEFYSAIIKLDDIVAFIYRAK